NNATVKDDLPNHIKFESVSIYPQRVNLQGKVVSVSEIPLVEGTDYILDKNTNNVTLIGRYAKTKESFKLVYETSVEDSIIPEDGGTIPVVNKATLINGDDEKVAPGKVNLKYGKLLDKSNPNRVKDSSAEGYVYSWQVYLNYGYKNLTPEQSKVTDKLTSNLKYIEGSVEVKSKAELSLVNGKDYIVKFNSDKNEMTIEFPKGLSTAVDISYKTEVVGTVDDVFKETSIKNQVSVGGKDPIVKSGTIAKNGIVKSGTVDYEKRKIKWTINFNTNHYELFNWSMIDTIPAGLTFIEGTLVIKSDSAKTPLPSSDYTHNLTKENELNVAFIGDLAKKGSKDSYTLTYETSFDRKVGTFVNKADTKWTDPTGDTEYKQKTTGNVTVNPFYVTDVSKYGEYDPNEKQLQWNVIVNYSQDELKNATISDPITGNQKLLKESVKVYELKINSDGSTSRVKEVTKDVSIEISDDNVFIKLPDGSKSAYELELKTSLANKDIAAKYQNTAIFENNGH
ncbi:MAG: collagen binding domain-containing protein, partial [Vagococcus sp.]